MPLLLLLLACRPPEAQAPATGDPDPVEPSPDADGDGWTVADGDCDDGDAAVHPDAAESCNQRDDDCDARVDEGLEHPAWYADGDGDSYGDPATQVTACAAPAAHWVPLGTDCDDADAGVHPGAEELCDDVDQDCDEEVDEGLPTTDWWTDADLDGYGDPFTEVEDCAAPPGTVANGEDCDDTDPDTFPGAAEDWTDDRDTDCDGQVERAGPVALTGAPGVVELSLELPGERGVRVVAVASGEAARVEVDLPQPTVLVLAGGAEWTVEDAQGTVEEVLVLASEGVDPSLLAVTALDDPAFWSQRQAIEALAGPISSWHGVAAGADLRLAEAAAWGDRDGWPDCDGAAPLDPILPPDPGVLAACPDLSGTTCLTATDEALVAFDLSGRTCTLAALPEPPAGRTLLWSGTHALLAAGPYGALARVDLTTGQRDRAWLWPEAALSHADGALLVPGEAQEELAPEIVYLYEGWGALACGDGANLTGVWAEDLGASTLSGPTSWWWEGGAELWRWELDRAVGGRLSVEGLDAVGGLAVLPDGRLAALVEGTPGEGALWLLDATTGEVVEVIEVGVAGGGLSCVGR